MLITQQKKTPTVATLKGIPNGGAGIRATLRVMVKLVNDGKKNIDNREIALSIVKNLPPKCWVCEAKAIQQFIFNNIRYTRDIDGIETVATPEKTLEYGQGDCDDMAVLAATLLQTIGHPVRFIAVGFNGKPVSHVLLETLIGSRWTPMELTENLPFGVYPANITRKQVAKIKL